MERFIERGTDYQLEHGQLSVYETNCACRDVKFFFEKNVLTIMVNGHKTVTSDQLKLEFFPGTFFIPERGVVQSVTIPNASIDNPTKCLVLEIDPAFLRQYYEEMHHSEHNKDILNDQRLDNKQGHFLSNDPQIIDVFIRLYQHRLKDHTRANEMIGTLILKELLLRVFQTEGLWLMIDNFEERIANHHIQKSISYIKANLQQKITVEQLARVSGLGTTTFFKKFKASTHFSPVDFILQERIKLSKVLILKNQYGLKEIAYKCGFNSYEYFCSSFKRLEQERPSDFKKKRYAIERQR